LSVQVPTPSFFVNSDSPFKTIQTYSSMLKPTLGNSMATLGLGQSMILQLNTSTKMGYKMTNVPYPKPGGVTRTLGGHTECCTSRLGCEAIRGGGQLKPLIIFAEALPAFPDVPCSANLALTSGLPQFRGIVARKGTADRSRF